MFLQKTWTKGHWPLDDLWAHICWGLMCDSLTLPKDHCVQVSWEYINVCGYSDQFCKLPHTYTYILHRPTYYIVYYIISDHSLSQARQKKKKWCLRMLKSFGPSNLVWELQAPPGLKFKDFIRWNVESHRKFYILIYAPRQQFFPMPWAFIREYTVNAG